MAAVWMASVFERLLLRAPLLFLVNDHRQRLESLHAADVTRIDAELGAAAPIELRHGEAVVVLLTQAKPLQVLRQLFVHSVERLCCVAQSAHIPSRGDVAACGWGAALTSGAVPGSEHAGNAFSIFTGSQSDSPSTSGPSGQEAPR